MVAHGCSEKDFDFMPIRGDGEAVDERVVGLPVRTHHGTTDPAAKIVRGH
jgi:hypothetical protein